MSSRRRRGPLFSSQNRDGYDSTAECSDRLFPLPRLQFDLELSYVLDEKAHAIRAPEDR